VWFLLVHITESATNTTSSNATLDNTLVLPGSLLKKIAEDLGDVYINNSDANLNNGYPVFTWQLENQEDIIGDVNLDGKFNVFDVILLHR